MSLVTVVFELRKRRVVSADDASPPNWIPQNWITRTFSFALDADAGLQENPGQVEVRSATRRHLVALVPPGTIDTQTPAVWPSLTILGGTRTLGGAEVLTNPLAAGPLDLIGGALPPAHVYFAEGEEVEDVGKWKGAPAGGPVIT
jgi:hypothetical protein